MSRSADIAQLRRDFQRVSEEMLVLVQAFELAQSPWYVQHCPMADDDRGANWLSKEKQIRNPYFGASMLMCGEVTKTL